MAYVPKLEVQILAVKPGHVHREVQPTIEKRHELDENDAECGPCRLSLQGIRNLQRNGNNDQVREYF